MIIVRASALARRSRDLLAAALGSSLLLLALVPPSLGAPLGPTRLLVPIVTPRTADTTMPITFRVTYRNAHDNPPEYVRVEVGATTYPMTAGTGNWKRGVVFSVQTTLPAGTHGVRFEALDAESFADEIDGGTVVIDGTDPLTSPSPTSAPSPTTPPAAPTAPPPRPTKGPPDATPAPTVAGPSPAVTDSPGPTDLAGPGSSHGSDSGSSEPHGTASAAPDVDLPDGDPEPTAPPQGAQPVVPLPGGDGPGGVGGTGGGQDPTSPSADAAGGEHGAFGDAQASPLDGFASWLGGVFSGAPYVAGLTGSGLLPTVPAVVGSTVAVTTWMAFVLFRRRNRDDEPPAPDAFLRAAAGTGIGLGVVSLPVRPPADDPEALMPRWRRPSLLEARKVDPVRAPAPERPRLTFARAAFDGGAGAERRAVRYAVIPLLDRPDEILASRIGELVAGDEVQVQQRSGTYCLVLCPDGRQGWIHRTTLGDLIEDRALGNASAGPEPEAENTLAALLAARGIG